MEQEKTMKKDTGELMPKFNRVQRRLIAKKMGLFRKENRRKHGFSSA
jgi:hypothetical protein